MQTTIWGFFSKVLETSIPKNMVKKSLKWPITQIAERVICWRTLAYTPGERVFDSFCTLFAMFFEVWPENSGQPKSARAF